MVDDDKVEFIPLAPAAFQSTLLHQTIQQFSLKTLYKRCTSKKGDLRDTLLVS